LETLFHATSEGRGRESTSVGRSGNTIAAIETQRADPAQIAETAELIDNQR
jgi:hypothetical protein